MKKTYKKQKLIIVISMFLLLIILGIVVTNNIISNNSRIESEGYFSTANANSELVARYIKKGITIGGVTGTLEVLDTTDATATAGEIINGYTAYAKGEKVTGTYEPIDTSDATATESEILSGYTAYVNGKKITGTFEAMGLTKVATGSANISWQGPEQNTATASWTATQNCRVIVVITRGGYDQYFENRGVSVTIDNAAQSTNNLGSTISAFVSIHNVKKGQTIKGSGTFWTTKSGATITVSLWAV